MTERQLQISVKTVGYVLFFGGWVMFFSPGLFPDLFKVVLPGWQFGWVWQWCWFAVVGVGACMGNAKVWIQKDTPALDTASLLGKFDEQLIVILNARTEERNASRLVLVKRLVLGTGLDLLDARQVVDDFCDRHAPDLPITFGNMDQV